MNRLLVGRFLSLGLLVVVVVLALSACGGDEKKAKARPLPEDPKALRPGPYRSEEFKPSLSFHVGKGWSSSPLEEASDFLEIARGQTAGLNFTNVQELYKPTKTGSANVVDAPKNIDGCTQQHPYLQTSKPEPVTVGGVMGLQFDDRDYPREHLACDLGPPHAEGAGADVARGYAPLRHHESERQLRVHPSHHLYERIRDRAPDLRARPARGGPDHLPARVHHHLGLRQSPVHLGDHPLELSPVLPPPAAAAPRARRRARPRDPGLSPTAGTLSPRETLQVRARVPAADGAGTAPPGQAVSSPVYPH